MLFTSYYFIFVFLPLAWLVVASLVFYGWWDVRFVPLLLLSVVGNFLAGEAIRRSLGQPKRTRLVLTAAICVNLGALGYYRSPGSSSVMASPFRTRIISPCLWTFCSSHSRRSLTWSTLRKASVSSEILSRMACSSRFFLT
jgi:hypothetical protein